MFCLQSNNASLDVGRRQLTCSGMKENKGAEGRQVPVERQGRWCWLRRKGTGRAPPQSGRGPSPAQHTYPDDLPPHPAKCRPLGLTSHLQRLRDWPTSAHRCRLLGRVFSMLLNSSCFRFQMEMPGQTAILQGSSNDCLRISVSSRWLMLLKWEERE